MIATLLFVGLCLTLAFLRPAAYIGFALLLTVLAKVFDRFSGGITGQFDEIAVVVAALVIPTVRLLRGASLRWFPGWGWFVLFIACGVVSGVSRQAPVDVTLFGAFLAIKGVLLGVAAAQIEWTDRHLRVASRWLAGVAIVIIGASLINLLVPTWWNGVFGLSGVVDYRYGLPSLIGPFVHPGDLGVVSACLALAILAYRQTVNRSRTSLALLVGMTSIGVLSLRTKTWAALAAGLSFLVAVRADRNAVRANRWAALSLLLMFIPLALVLVWPLVSEGVNAVMSRYEVSTGLSPREAMAAGAVAIAATHFPLGAGFGRYGTFVAKDSYSPEYVQLGFPSIWGLSPEGSGSSDYLLDTQWPAVLGETGWVGAVAFGVGLLCLFLAAYRGRKSSSPWTACLSLIACAWVIEIVIESLASPALMASPSFALVFVVTGALAARTADEARITRPIAHRRPGTRVPAKQRRV